MTGGGFEELLTEACYLAGVERRCVSVLTSPGKIHLAIRQEVLVRGDHQRADGAVARRAVFELRQGRYQMRKPARRRGCATCRGRGKLRLYHRNNERVEGPMGEVTIPDKVACQDCCLHNGAQKLTAGRTAIRVNCRRCGAFLGSRPIIEGGRARTTTAEEAPPPAPCPTMATPEPEALSGQPRARKRRRKLARKARGTSKPGLPPNPSHIVLHFAHIWDDTVRGTIRWKARSTTQPGWLNMGVQFERPLRVKGVGKQTAATQDHTFSIISIKPDGTCHPPWASIVEES